MQTSKSEYSNFPSDEEKLPKNCDGTNRTKFTNLLYVANVFDILQLGIILIISLLGSSQSSQSYSGSMLVLSGSDLSQLTLTPKSEHFKFSADEEKSPKNLKGTNRTEITLH
ncbi:hypothetical protein F8M41_008539 [Gigaspora margarita]|uniref:Uncharacterized protein n=1 Tax=Gigaspora margarita TaxID=4874 RepID=A0A8H4B4B3_GIGMA|nr:hypothetical protein F8M41_008539 [Gigaspora margarita]